MRRLWTLGLGTALACLPILAAPAAAGTKKDAEEKEQRVVRQFRFIGSGGGHLGVALKEVDRGAVERLKLPEERGALVQQVTPGSPAEKAGVEADDVIVSYRGEPVEGVAELVRRVRETPAGRSVTLEVLRKGATQKLTAVLDERTPEIALGSGEMPEFNFQMPDVEVPEIEIPDVEVPAMPHLPGHPGAFWYHGTPWTERPRRLGIEFQEIRGQLAQYFKVAEKRGVLVTSVEPDGPAAGAGVQVGDVILKVAGEKIERGRDLRRVLDDVEAGEEIGLTVQRDGKPLDLKLTAGGKPHETPARDKQIS